MAKRSVFPNISVLVLSLLSIAGLGVFGASPTVAQAIQHDAEHYVLLHQYAEQWAAEDKDIDQRLAEIRERNGGKRPNIVYILLDDMGFGEYGIPALDQIRGGNTPRISQLM